MHFAVLRHARPHERPPTRDHVAFTEKLPGVVGDDERVGGAGGAQDLDLSRDDQEERHGLVANLNQHLSTRDRPPSSVRRDPRDLCSRERGEQPLRGGRRLWAGWGNSCQP